MDRRSLIRSLFALPALTVTVRDVPVQKGPYRLPIGCDLSLCALQWTYLLAYMEELGKPKFLLVGPENKKIAYDLVGDYKRPYTGNSEINCLWPGFPIEVVDSLPFATWKMVFERGVVVSEGPR